MSNEKRDLIIHYDEDEQKIIFYSTAVANTEKIRATEFDGVCPDVSFFQAKSPSEAEQALGGMVFSLLDLHALKKMGIRDYEAEAELAHQQYRQELEGEVLAGDTDAYYHLFIELHSSAMKNRSMDDLERAENLLTTAVGQGHGEAIKMLEQWPDLKAAALRRIQRGANG